MQLSRKRMIWISLAVVAAALLWHFRTQLIVAMTFQGEKVSYVMINRAANTTLYSGKLAVDENMVLDGFSVREPWQPSPGIEIPAHNTAAPPDLNHRIPEIANLTWRLSSESGKEKFSGEVVGPFIVRLRNQIPIDVLKKIKGQTPFTLHFFVEIGITPVRVKWILTDHSGDFERIITKGGDW
jgi:hypothetical protein